MTVLSDRQLYEAGMLTDEIAGFRAVLANPRVIRLGVDAPLGLAPDHFSGLRLERFVRGANVAARWLISRNAAGRARRAHRANEIKQYGACTPIDREKSRQEAIAELNYLLGIGKASPA